MSSTPRRIGDPRLYVAAALIESSVPDYDPKQSDPTIAAEKGIGNCVSKAIIGAILLEKAMLVGAKPALAWNTKTHPKVGEDLFGKPVVRNGHAQLVVANTAETPQIHAISFNPMSQAGDDWELFDFNEDEQYAKVSCGSITTTRQGDAVGFIVKDWHEGGKHYAEALGIYDSVFHNLGASVIATSVEQHLVTRNILNKFSSDNLIQE